MSRGRGPESGRSVAVQALSRVFSDQAYAAAVLAQAFGESSLPAVDRGLATELVYGVLRTERYLRRRLERHTDLGRAEPEVLVILLVGAYQLDFLDRVPAHAAVSESVELGHRLGKWAAGFINAVLRKVASDTESRLPAGDAMWTSVPAWLKKRLERDVGPSEARALLVPEASPRPDLRLRPGRSAPEGAELGPTCLEGAWRYLSGGDPTAHPAYARGDFQVQELGSQIVASLVAARPGERVLDACAGRGQKTMCLLDAGAEVLSTDVHPHKLAALEVELRRYGLSAGTRAVDFTAETPADLLGAFDAVLVDAPCTGTGTLRRRPEIMRRLGPDSPAQLASLQAALLRQAAGCLAPNGRLIYSVCSVLREEGEAVLQTVRDLLRPAPWPLGTGGPGLAAGATSVRLLPTTTGSDGYFVAQLVRLG